MALSWPHSRPFLLLLLLQGPVLHLSRRQIASAVPKLARDECSLHPLVEGISLCNRQRPLEKSTANQKADLPAQSQRIHRQNIPTPQAQGWLQKREWKDGESQRIGEFAVGLRLLGT
ncbi:rCG21460, isoform CRA_b [Rattus norvegicus]|uniref:RCG21460, isoform CRA_b n=1 Tax=Rattus norvegicus TaxID=10116 RepID=A6J229_RAT|nr:rCG21460, isoform CRA_b [Rattus norvegicus]